MIVSRSHFQAGHTECADKPEEISFTERLRVTVFDQLRHHLHGVV